MNFLKNIVGKHLIQIYGARNVILNQTICQENNYQQNHEGEILEFGGCFRTENILNRHFYSIKIIKCFSDTTTFGITIIDKEEILSYYNLDQNKGDFK